MQRDLNQITFWHMSRFRFRFINSWECRHKKTINNNILWVCHNMINNRYFILFSLWPLKFQMVSLRREYNIVLLQCFYKGHMSGMMGRNYIILT